MAEAARAADCGLPLKLQDVQSLYDLALSERDRRNELLASFGVAFGELFISLGDYEWVHVTDEYGRELSIAVIGTDTVCHPISMIDKRLERGETVDIEWLREATISHMQRLCG
ncbi:DUF3806 domain-containing protein [Qipengyuania sp. 6B39]|uniref:DUF3806 domain-containing protein n=1 Tax=Qipengyuania proteolytica TaxID=2867239 RepID=UPI001C8A61F1|nr:DUF3806 domain-containing protein [Qipengyuania proteolytica]MBX7496235.1 DUF3806 domain-containing protein [Qipengyuania proteolytica]